MPKPDYIQEFHKQVLNIWRLWSLPASRNALQGNAELRAPVSKLIDGVEEVLRAMDRINRRQKTPHTEQQSKRS
jgi:hypothetical protein